MNTSPEPVPSASDAIPVLSYERQTDEGAMVWVVRFTGAWVICHRAPSLLAYLALGWRSMWLFTVAPGLLGMLAALVGLGFATIVFGYAIVRRRRYGFIGAMVVVLLSSVLTVLQTLSTTNSAEVRVGALTGLLEPAAEMGMLFSAFVRAARTGVLQSAPASRGLVPQGGSDIGFLISRLGWIYVAYAASSLLDLAVRFVLDWASGRPQLWTNLLTWQALNPALEVAIGACGLMLCKRRAAALWFLAALLPIQRVGLYLLVLWRFYFAGGLPFSERGVLLIQTVLGTAAIVWMLCLLARRAARERE